MKLAWKELEEQRKAGTAPAMVDVETGRDINPHIPEFIEQTPWYVPSTGPTLKHQRPHPERKKRLASVAEWYPKGTTDRVAFKYRDGACENCGAFGHSKKNCLEKPRLIGAKFTNADIAADDHRVLPTIEMGYDAKRDRWNGYNVEDYALVAAEFEKMEETRKLIRAEQLKKAGEEDKKAEADEDIYAEDASAAGQSVDMDSRTRITVRNLRIREDTAKYLYSLDPDGAYYDPKSRSMRENLYKNVPGKELEAAKFSGEIRFTGEVAEANEAQVFAWQATCKGIDVHTLAEPTRLEALKREFEKQKEDKKSTLKNELLDKYGGEEHLHSLPRELMLAQTEKYVEYNRKGKVIKGGDRPTVRSRYVENISANNHSTVWGSYWRDGRWGYACCHQFLQGSYCIGEQGIIAEGNELGTTGFVPQKIKNQGCAKRNKKRQRHKEQLKKCEDDETRGEKCKRMEDNSEALFPLVDGSDCSLLFDYDVNFCANKMPPFLFPRALPSLNFHRSIFRPPLNSPFCGIYRTNGEICRMDDILVCQRKMNYHPGANVSHQRDRNQHLLKADCDGTVQYAFRDFENIYKLTFNPNFYQKKNYMEVSNSSNASSAQIFDDDSVLDITGIGHNDGTEREVEEIAMALMAGGPLPPDGGHVIVHQQQNQQPNGSTAAGSSMPGPNHRPLLLASFIE
uniref:Pre-mRNA-splicing factor SLU7 n=1 Tax=Globodera rostochiensis TaxID=31243 RepID=A0A914HFN9_GLORO